MLRLLAIATVLLPLAAMAQEVPAEAQMDMWCGTAFDLMTREAPADATPEKLAAARPFADGGQFLVQRAIPIYLESGYSDQALETYRQRLEQTVGRVVNGGAGLRDDAPYSFQDCSALIGQSVFPGMVTERMRRAIRARLVRVVRRFRKPRRRHPQPE